MTIGWMTALPFLMLLTAAPATAQTAQTARSR